MKNFLKPAQSVSVLPLFSNMSHVLRFYRPGIIDEILTGLVQMSSESFDPIYSFNMQNMLFRMMHSPFGQDLLSFDIQRGRDYGLPSYLELRAACGLPPARSFADLEEWMPPYAVANLAKIYRHVLDIVSTLVPFQTQILWLEAILCNNSKQASIVGIDRVTAQKGAYGTRATF